MAEVHGLAGEADVLLEGQGRAVDHDGGEARVHGLAHVVERLAMVQVQRHGHGVAVHRQMGHLGDEVVARELDVRGRNLDDAGHAVRLEGIHDGQGHLHVGGIVGGEHHIVLLGDSYQGVHINERHGCHPFS